MSDEDDKQPTADLNLKVPGIGEANIKNIKSVNTILTAGAFVGIGFVAYLLLFPVSVAMEQHRLESREAGAAFVGAIKEQTSAIKEQTAVARKANCLSGYQGPMERRSEFCDQVTR